MSKLKEKIDKAIRLTDGADVPHEVNIPLLKECLEDIAEALSVLASEIESAKMINLIK
jgi:hypothetical protein